MYHRYLVTFLTILVWIGSTHLFADTIDIRVQKDVSLHGGGDRSKNYNNLNHKFLWVGNGNYEHDSQGMFGFDVSGLTGLLSFGDVLTISSMKFSAYNNYDGTGLDGDILIALGNTDIWNADTVTWNSSAGNHGAVIDSFYDDATTVNNWHTWDVTSIGTSQLLDNDYVTFYLFSDSSDLTNFHDYESEEYLETDNAAYLRINYEIQSQAVPTPTSLAALIGMGFMLMGFVALSRRRERT